MKICLPMQFSCIKFDNLRNPELICYELKKNAIEDGVRASSCRPT